MVSQSRVDQSPQRTPPYVPWSQLKQFLDKIRVLNPRIIDLDYLKSNQMGGQQPGPLMAAIQFLGLVDLDNVPTDKLDQLRVRGEQQFSTALENIVKNAYSDLLDAVNVEEADRDTIYNQVRTVYQCSPRVAETATPLFLALAQESGMNVSANNQKGSNTSERKPRQAAQVAQRRGDAPRRQSGIESGRRQSVDSVNSTAGEGDYSNFDSGHTKPIVQINLQIHVDADASAEQIDRVFSSMAKHLYPGNESGLR
ncbi:MAG: DUF5343 domain-containing protein [Chloroflexi bacterium]|nr:DUF5343 domain-containing protein [Chloroflexota bacterium]